MRCFLVVLSFVGLGATLAAVPASAQSTSEKSGASTDANSGEGFSLLRIAKVQNDLQLSEQQKVQILSLSMEMRNNRFNMKKKLAEILDPDQLNRLKQIRLQVEGPAGMNSHEVAMALGLTQEQRAGLRALQNQIRADLELLVQEVRGLTIDQRRAKFPEMVRKIQEIRKETTQQALELLTPKQQEMFEKMQGKKLSLDPPMP